MPCRLKIFRSVSQVKKNWINFLFFKMDFGWCVDGETVNLSLSLCDTKEVEKTKDGLLLFLNFSNFFVFSLKSTGQRCRIYQKRCLYSTSLFFDFQKKKKKFRRNISKTWKQKFGRTRISHLFFFSNTYKNRVR